MRGLGTRFFGGSRVPVNRRGRGSSATAIVLPSPIWTATPTYTAEDGVSSTAYTLPVGASGDVVTVTWVSGTISGSTVLTQPVWIEFTQGVSPTIRFTGAQVDANDVTNLVLRATSSGGYSDSSPGTITISPASIVSPGISIVYTPSTIGGTPEGYVSVDGTAGGSYPRHTRGEVLYESAYTTKDGTMIEHADGAHGTVRWTGDLSQTVVGSGNRVGEFIPSTDGGVTPGRITEVYPENREDHGVQSYDNQIYLYFERPDVLVLFRHGVYNRTVTDTMVTRTWTGPTPSDPMADYWSPSKGSTSNSGVSAWTHIQNQATNERFPRNSSYAPVPSGRPPVYSASSTSNAFMYTYGWFAGIEQQFGWYNVHSAYSRQLDCAVIIGGASASNQVESPSLSIIVPSGLVSSSIVPPYTVLFTQMSKAACVVDGARWMLNSGRAGCKFYGNYVYWGGGADQWQSGGSEAVPYFFRADLRPVLANPTADLTTTFLPERLADMPLGIYAPGLSVDPFSNTMLMLGTSGLFLYDPTAGAWSSYATRGQWTNVTSQFAEFAATFSGNGGNYISNPHIDFINYRNTTKLRKTYFFGGWTYGDNTNKDEKYHKVRSVQVTRTFDISFLTTTAANPENPSADLSGYGGMFQNIKHQGLLTVGSGTTRKMYLWSGDWDYGYPQNTNYSGYKSEAGGGVLGDGRQEIWMADISTSALASPSGIRWTMVHNGYHAYPWTGSQGYYNTAQKGPQASDSLGMVVDKRGQFWMGPCDYNDYLSGSANNLPEYRGADYSYAAMFQWNQPSITNNTATTGAGVNGVALGNGWTLPSQDRLQKSTGGTPVTDYDISASGANSSFGWGRVPGARGSIYDSTNDRIYVISLGADAANKRVTVQLYGFNPDPAAAALNGGKYAWTKYPSKTINLREYGGPADNQYSGLNFGGWGDNLKGNLSICPQMIGRKIYFVACFSYTGATNGLSIKRGDGATDHHTRGHLWSINVDTRDMEWIPFSQANWDNTRPEGWWTRVWDGPDSWDAYLAGEGLTPAQQRSLCAIGDKLIVGPDNWHKLNVDPWFQIYDTTRKVWTVSQPPTDHDWPNTLDALVAVPDLNEAWMVGAFTGLGSSTRTFMSNHGMAIPPSNAGRRILRFKVG